MKNKTTQLKTRILSFSPISVCPPDKMIEMIKGELNVFDTERNKCKCRIENNGSAFDSDTKQIEPNSLEQLTLLEILNTKQKHSSPSKHRLSQKSLSLQTLKDRLITLVPEVFCGKRQPRSKICRNIIYKGHMSVSIKNSLSSHTSSKGGNRIKTR